MPRIRRYYPASHMLNRDPEFMHLRRHFADWMGYVWHEMLAWGDHTEGTLKGDPAEIALTLAQVSLQIYPRRAAHAIEKAFTYMQDCGWIEVRSDRIVILNHAKFHGSWESNKSQEGNNNRPPLPNLPTDQPTVSKEVVSSFEDTTFSEQQNGAAPTSDLPASHEDFAGEKMGSQTCKKKPEWPEDGLFVKQFLDAQTYFSAYTSDPKTLARACAVMDDPVWWESLSQELHGIDVDFLNRQFAGMARWWRENPSRLPGVSGLKKHIGGWLKRNYEKERKDQWRLQKGPVRLAKY